MDWLGHWLRLNVSDVGLRHDIPRIKSSKLHLLSAIRKSDVNMLHSLLTARIVKHCDRGLVVNEKHVRLHYSPQSLRVVQCSSHVD